jgi:hypothetical protein
MPPSVPTLFITPSAQKKPREAGLFSWIMLQPQMCTWSLMSRPWLAGPPSVPRS